MLAHVIKPSTAALAVLVAGVLSAAPAQAEYRGGGVVHTFSGCETYGWHIEDAWPVRGIYGPSEVFGNPSTISLFNAWGGAWHFNANVEFAPGPSRYLGRGGWIHRTMAVWPERPRIRVLERSVVLPRNETFANALVVDLRMRVFNFAGVRGCAASVDLTLHRRD